jgi:hypothetical protein
MEYCKTSPNQWNPETEDDHIHFDRYMRKLATMDDAEFDKLQKTEIPLQQIPEKLSDPKTLDDRLALLSIHFNNYLIEIANKRVRGEIPSVFKGHTPATAREYVKRMNP